MRFQHTLWCKCLFHICSITLFVASFYFFAAAAAAAIISAYYEFGSWSRRGDFFFDSTRFALQRSWILNYIPFCRVAHSHSLSRLRSLNRWNRLAVSFCIRFDFAVSPSFSDYSRIHFIDFSLNLLLVFPLFVSFDDVIVCLFVCFSSLSSFCVRVFRFILFACLFYSCCALTFYSAIIFIQ